jgi:hypothetical protein
MGIQNATMLVMTFTVIPGPASSSHKGLLASTCTLGMVLVQVAPLKMHQSTLLLHSSPAMTSLSLQIQSSFHAQLDPN